MRKIREVLRLKYELGRSNREIARSLKTSHSTVGDYVRRAHRAGVTWPLPEGWDDDRLTRELFPAPPPTGTPRPLPDWAEVVQRHEDLRSWETRTFTHLVLQLVG